MQPRPGDEILWSADIFLFQDELHDNGDSTMNVRIRVTPNYFFVLQRLFVRVDNVIFRVKDTRLHHKFGDAHALRQYTEREQAYEQVVKSCRPKEIRDGILHDANQLLERIPVKSDTTQKISFKQSPAAGAMQASAEEIAAQERLAQQRAAEEAFKKKFGNVKPSAGALLQRQKKHETRYFDSGDAFSSKTSDALPHVPGEKEELPQPIDVLGGEVPRRAPSTEPKDEAPKQPSAEEIAAQQRVAEEAFKKKFGNLKPSAGALLQRQKKHETRYFDSGDAFSSKTSDALPSMPGEKEELPQPIDVLGGDVPRRASSSEHMEETHKVAQPSAEEIAAQQRVAEEAFKKKFGSLKPSAGALLQRQKKHETRYFDSGDAFSSKTSDELPHVPGEQEEPPQPIDVLGGEVPRHAPATEAPRDDGPKQPSAQEIAAQQRIAEEAFKKKFGSLKPSAGALLQRQKKHETRYFDSGDAFSSKTSDALPHVPGEKEELPQPIAASLLSGEVHLQSVQKNLPHH